MVIAKSAATIAELAGFAIPADRTFLVVEEDGVGEEHPFSGEKLSVVLALYHYDGGIEHAVDLVNAITGYQGLGHTCGIHTSRDDHVDALALGTKTGRVLVNQNLNEGAGSPRNGFAVHTEPELWHLGRQHHHRERQRPPLREPHLGVSADPPTSGEPGGTLRRALAATRSLSIRCSRQRIRCSRQSRRLCNVCHARVASCRLKLVSGSVRSCPEISRIRCNR